MSQPQLLAIDQGTTSSRAILFSADGQIISQSSAEFDQHYPQPGWVEHDAEQIWQTVQHTCRTVLQYADQVAAVGLTNQRETIVLWERGTGQPLAPAIVWQDRRTADLCQRLRADGHEPQIQAKTGLLLDPYFSASKIAWALDHYNLRDMAARGDLLSGTIDSYLIYRLTSGEVHATDATNASRTSLFNIHTQDWDDDLLALFNIPRSILPDVRDCVADYGMTTNNAIGIALPLRGVAGDQQAATIGQGCFAPGSIKSTYGTGCFALVNTGTKPLTSANRLLTTVAYRLDGNTTYALEGSIFIAGAAVQWLRDSLGLITTASETEDIAKSINSTGGVYLVPAFAGLGAPYWDAHARGSLTGLTRGSGRAEIIRATLESIAYQTHDLISAMARDGITISDLRVDGGMVANTWLMQFMADICQIPLNRPKILETTALGAAFLAGLGAGIYAGLGDIQKLRHSDAVFSPAQATADVADLLNGWQTAVARTLHK